MNDLISRQAAIDAIKEQIFARIDWLSDSRMERKGLDVALCVIEDLPSAQPEQQWIPCSERPPELGKYVMVTTSWMFVTKAMYCGEHWEIDGIDYKKSSVFAWMPLPEPYGGD